MPLTDPASRCAHAKYNLAPALRDACHTADYKWTRRPLQSRATKSKH